MCQGKTKPYDNKKQDLMSWRNIRPIHLLSSGPATSDVGDVPKDDIVMFHPDPVQAGGTTRAAKSFIFHCDDLNVYRVLV